MAAQIRQAVQQQVAVELKKELEARGIDSSQSAEAYRSRKDRPTNAEDSFGEEAFEKQDPDMYSFGAEDIDTEDIDTEDFEEDIFKTEEQPEAEEAEEDETGFFDMGEDEAGFFDMGEDEDSDSQEDTEEPLEEAEASDEEDAEEYEEEYEEEDSFFNISEEDTGEEDNDFDLMNMLTQLADEMEDITPIDVMDAYGEEVVDISLEDLVKYVKKTIYHQS